MALAVLAVPVLCGSMQIDRRDLHRRLGAFGREFRFRGGGFRERMGMFVVGLAHSVVLGGRTSRLAHYFA